MKEFGESSTKLEFDEFDSVAVDGEQPERKSSDQLSAEEADEVGKGEDDEEDDELESKPEKTKPPTADEYQWQWKVSDLGSHLVPQRIDQTPQPQLETTRRTFFL